MTIPTFPSLLGVAFPVIRRNMGFDVVKLQSVQGVRSRFALRNAPMYQWELSFEFLRDNALSSGSTGSDGTTWARDAYVDLQTLIGFYNSCLGPELPFMYWDASDNTATNSRFGTGDGATFNFQLTRTFGGFTEPVYGSPNVAFMYVNGSVLAGNAWDVSETGVVTFFTPPAASATLVWSGSYRWLCQFDDDNVEFSNFMSGYWEARSLKFSNLVLP